MNKNIPKKWLKQKKKSYRLKITFQKIFFIFLIKITYPQDQFNNQDKKEIIDRRENSSLVLAENQAIFHRFRKETEGMTND